ncbi:hypothetical protein IQ273_10365 [Nodosilinea sp. LEGE 07298]|uniref:hypothetical protein n=1 Tax=Nodosilinea sp. LEGE 07298 TaxID=2777970 RepID=UPI00188283AC|nr:hypothetical protein [Nodosilinea sp. LEGE 07298]MBE9109814.1 hypothetical protein [Nodosilinea sp. LEGE 07298]
MTTSPVKRPVQALLSRQEYQLLQDLRQRSPAQQPISPRLTVSDRISDKVATLIVMLQQQQQQLQRLEDLLQV